GSISPSGTTEVTCGEDLNYTITADLGYAVADVLVNGVSVGAVVSYTFESVTEDQTITASFVEYEAPDYYDGIGVFEKITSISDLTDGYYVITNETDAFAMNNTHNASNYFESTAVSPVSGQIINPSAAIVWKIEANGAGKTIYNEVIEKYVGWISGNSASAED